MKTWYQLALLAVCSVSVLGSITAVAADRSGPFPSEVQGLVGEWKLTLFVVDPNRDGKLNDAKRGAGIAAGPTRTGVRRGSEATKMGRHECAAGETRVRTANEPIPVETSRNFFKLKKFVFQ